jgi:flagellar hook-length control protein FliK
MLGSGLPAGQPLPVGGSDLPVAANQACAGAPTPGCAPALAPPTADASSATAQQLPTDLADLFRLALARDGAAQPQPQPPTDAAGAAADAVGTAAAAAAAGTAPATAPLDPARASPGKAPPVDLATLLGLDPAPQTAAPPTAALATEPSERLGSDSARRASSSGTPEERAAQLAASELANADATAPRAPELQAPAAPAAAVAIGAKSARLDDALPLVVAPAASADAGSAPALPPFAHASSSTAAASSAPAQGPYPQSLGDSVDTTSARWHEALASRIQWLVDHDVGEAKIKLNPPELGALDVKIALLDDKTYVQMTAHSASARDELSQGLPRLRELLAAGGLEFGGATVTGGRDERAGYQGTAQPLARAAPFAATAEAIADVPRARLGAHLAVIDTFA